MKLSILMPVYNESSTAGSVVKRILDTGFPCDDELVIVDDGSTDGSAEALTGLEDPRVLVIRHERNRGSPRGHGRKTPLWVGWG